MIFFFLEMNSFLSKSPSSKIDLSTLVKFVRTEEFSIGEGICVVDKKTSLKCTKSINDFVKPSSFIL